MKNIMRTLKYALAVGIAAVLFAGPVAAQVNCQRVGMQTFCSNGYSQMQIGNGIYGNNGYTGQVLGNTLYGNNGVNWTAMGNQFYSNTGRNCIRTGAFVNCY